MKKLLKEDFEEEAETIGRTSGKDFKRKKRLKDED
jgi:hypothetical protein